MSSNVPRRAVFVLSGGGNLGAVQVGMLRGLLEAGIRPDAVVGTSIGALNGAFLAGHNDIAGIEALTELWTSVRRSDAFPFRISTLARGMLGRQPFMFDSLGLQSVLARAQFGFDRLEEAPLPLRVVTTDICSGEAVVLTKGDTVRALLASSAIPGVFSSVEIDGRTLVDGGVVANTPIVQAEELDPTVIYVLPTMPDRFPAAPTRAIVMFQRAVSLSIKDVERRALQVARTRRPVWVLPVPDSANNLSALDFGATRRLISEAHDLTSSWIEDNLATRGQVEFPPPQVLSGGDALEEVAA